jgi:tetratricopeptide (TPR) repeat protein
MVVFPIAVLVILLQGCTTSETMDDGFDITLPEPGKPDTILDSRLKVLKERAAEYPLRSDLQYKLAVIYYQKEDYRAASTHLRKAIQLDPNHVRYHYDLGRVHMQMGELEQAEAAFRTAIERAGSKRWSGLFSSHGYVLCHLQRWEEARQQFETSIAIDARDPTPYYFLGSIADIQANPEQAVSRMREYLERGGKAFRRRAVDVLRHHGVEVDDVAEGGDGATTVAKTSAALPELPDLPLPNPSPPEPER